MVWECENINMSDNWKSHFVTIFKSDLTKKSDSGHCMNIIHNSCNVWNYEWASSEIVTMVYHHWWCCHRWFLPFCASNLMHALPWISRSTQLAKKSDERHSKLCKTLMDAILSLSLSVSFSLSLQKNLINNIYTDILQHRVTMPSLTLWKFSLFFVFVFVFVFVWLCHC